MVGGDGVGEGSVIVVVGETADMKKTQHCHYLQYMHTILLHSSTSAQKCIHAKYFYPS